MYPGLARRSVVEWPALSQQVYDGLSQLTKALCKGWDEMQAERRANGTHTKFCGE